MLKQRVITAFVLLVVLLGTLIVPTPWPFLILISGVAGAVLWEWLRLTLSPDKSTIALIGGGVMGLLLLILADHMVTVAPELRVSPLLSLVAFVVVPIVGLAWVIGSTAVVLQAHTESRRHNGALSLFGVAAVLALWFALAYFFIVFGAWFLVSMMALIWIADSAAYFVGKAFGRHKLAPRVSPGKTWQGALGGVAGAMLWMAISSMWGNSFAAVLTARWGFVMMLVFAALLASLSIVGDLFESILKRRAGVKDSSQLLPGHGGVYDRIDALFPVAPVALVLVGM